MKRCRVGWGLSGLLILFIISARGAENPAPAHAENTPNTTELQQLRELLKKQQEQIDSLRGALEQQQKLLEKAAATPITRPATDSTDRMVASTTSILPPAVGAPAAKPQNVAPGSSAAPTPLQIRIGDVGIMPVGFMDATLVWRNVNAGSGIGSNFAAVPYNNTNPGHLSEMRFSPQNSRLGFRVDGDWKGARFLAYNEFDFLGTSGANNIGVTNGAFVPRLRLFWIDVRKGKYEVLAGQSWSMMTPNRKGISPLPGDLFYSQVVDVNYMIGLPWSRQPGVRFLLHPSETFTLGLSVENPNQYVGGSAGGPQITPPASLSGLLGTQLDNGSTSPLSTPNLAPDIILKAAADPSSRAHFEVAGMVRSFKVFNPNSSKTLTSNGFAGSFNANFELVKNFRLVTNNFWSDGGGRYLFGTAPDVIIRGDGSLSPIHSAGFVEGFEATIKNTLVYAYWGNVLIQRNTAIASDGKTVGYGYTGSPNNQNRTINEASAGFIQTLWKDARYGALSFMGQYEWLNRNPWFVAANAPKSAHDNTIYINLRYTLPGAPPAPAKK